MKNHQLINQDSGKKKLYTPPEIIKIVRAVLGRIDLDGASDEDGNRIVGATEFYTDPNYKVRRYIEGLPVREYEGTGGLDYSWFGRVWLNPPFGQAQNPCLDYCTKKVCINRGWHAGTFLPGIYEWINHLIGNYHAGNISEAMTICFNATETRHVQLLMLYPFFAPASRINYGTYDPDGSYVPLSGVTKGSLIFYMGPDIKKFKNACLEMGPGRICLPVWCRS